MQCPEARTLRIIEPRKEHSSTVRCAMLRQAIAPGGILARIRHRLRNTSHLMRALALRLCFPRVHGGHHRTQWQKEK
eukprot:SAG11_NODE_12513_length_699_cov_1.358333_2_plen_77_part_00